ncbi:MAG: deoxyribodipyrimidine photo-lyase [Flavobacteriaceae bacterium]
MWETDHVATYKNTRNGLLGTEYSTKFSAWLANGSISARTIYVELKKYEASRTKNESTYWVFFELLWRDFFKCVGLKYGDRIFKSGGILNKEFADGQDYKKFESWKNGSTGDAFINANMKELARTGWMSNRGRQNVASFWSKSWEQDWRVGAAYFESVLIDYDVDCNWGNWMYISGVGNDPRDRIFDSKRQAQMYDASGSFQKKWL